MIDINKRKFKRFKIGRKDKNGNPIKEGDIIEVHGKLSFGGIVIYNEKGCGFCFDDNNKDEYTFSAGWCESQESTPEESWEVIGSIYGKSQLQPKVKDKAFFIYDKTPVKGSIISVNDYSKTCSIFLDDDMIINNPVTLFIKDIFRLERKSLFRDNGTFKIYKNIILLK